jgi:protein gp37
VVVIMAEQTIIAWTDKTFNAWMGCTKVSDGCAHCYAATMTKNRMGLELWGDKANRQITKTPWKNVIQWQKQASTGEPGLLNNGKYLVFLGSLMDWAEDRPDLKEPRERMWQIIRDCPDLWFQMLTKRPENIRKFLPEDWGDGYKNVWLGTSVEDMRVAWRADSLRDIPAVVRFISYEPALGSLRNLNLSGIDWVIIGGESGPGYRQMDAEWAREMRIKCAATGAAFFFKQGSAIRTEMHIEMDGEIVRKFPIPRLTKRECVAERVLF